MTLHPNVEKIQERPQRARPGEPRQQHAVGEVLADDVVWHGANGSEGDGATGKDASSTLGTSFAKAGVQVTVAKRLRRRRPAVNRDSGRGTRTAGPECPGRST